METSGKYGRDAIRAEDGVKKLGKGGSNTRCFASPGAFFGVVSAHLRESIKHCVIKIWLKQYSY